MKTNKVIIVLFLLAIVSFAIGLSGCSILYYEEPISVYSPNYVHPSVQAMRDQDAIYRANAIAYAKKNYSGKTNIKYTNSAKANTIIGTQYDSFKYIRNAKIGVPIITPTQDIRLYIK